MKQSSVLFVVLFLYFFWGFLNLSFVNAQGQGTFGCIYNTPNCQVDPSDVNCDQGYCPDYFHCTQYDFQPTECDNAQNIFCIPCSPTCIVSTIGTQPYSTNTDIVGGITYAQPNSYYCVNDTGGCTYNPTNACVTTDDNGVANFTLNCPSAGTFTLIASNGNQDCQSYTFSVINQGLCANLPEGPGTCTTIPDCPLPQERGQHECPNGWTCCAPANECIGLNSGRRGECYPQFCPVWNNRTFDGSYPEVCGPLFNICCTNQIPPQIIRDPLNNNCPNGSPGINTAIGCIPVQNNNDFLVFILPWAIGVAGGVAFVLIIFAGFLIMTSAGDPQRLQAGKELLTAAVLALVLIITSVFILDVIGVRILRLPGF